MGEPDGSLENCFFGRLFRCLEFDEPVRLSFPSASLLELLELLLVRSLPPFLLPLLLLELLLRSSSWSIRRSCIVPPAKLLLTGGVVGMLRFSRREARSLFLISSSRILSSLKMLAAWLNKMLWFFSSQSSALRRVERR